MAAARPSPWPPWREAPAGTRAVCDCDAGGGDVMADVTVTTLLSGGGAVRAQFPIVWKSPSVGYCFYISSTGTSDLVYKKTTDSGGTWGAEVSVSTDTVLAFGCWYDQWTPGDSGTKI